MQYETNTHKIHTDKHKLIYAQCLGLRVGTVLCYEMNQVNSHNDESTNKWPRV